ncbi:AcrR family transcriptional regulator [Allocatelliglobosispora scoriae]|uniref:AcrR family transcriptional regulator n=1 Tax=Allocatelliglobosispora scoriae TaxID=643052 RepID=A0A841C2R2_9ACTN|nr:TetR/AcrR family transcriptional regulator [Allocatelliglobosispora scoriae]MBB5873413.1 AcrR family transcriptional regulator [Allocatelliglobosispora scoriae]
MDKQQQVATAGDPCGDTYGGQSRQERSADRRHRILTSSRHIFAARGYDDVTVADVCAHSGVAKRDFYEHFADRESLLLAVHREQNDWLLAGITAAAPPHPAGLDELFRATMGAKVALLLAHPDRARVIYINAPRLETRRRELLREEAVLFDGLLHGVPAGPRDRLRSDRLLLALMAGVAEVLIEWLAGGMADAPDVLVDHLTELAVAALSESAALGKST